MSEEAAAGPSPVVLIVGGREPGPVDFLEGRKYDVVHVHSGAVALEWASSIQADAILVASDLDDLRGIEVCRRLSDQALDPTVPLFLLTPQAPAVGERLAALRAGAWDCLGYPDEADDLTLKLQAYLQMRQHIGWPAIERRRRRTAPRIPLGVSVP